MRNYLNENKFCLGGKICNELSEILHNKFIADSNGIFFKHFYSENVKNTLNFGGFFDLSGYEYSINKFHIDDYCGKDSVLATSICFMDEFESIWRDEFRFKKCISVISYDKGEEFGDSATFSFYVERGGHSIIDIKNIDKYEDAIFVRII